MRLQPEQVIELQKKAKEDLTPKEFVALWKYESTQRRTDKIPHTAKQSDDELYEVYKTDPNARKSANRLKQSIKLAGLACSHNRAATLFLQFQVRETQDGQ